MEAKTAELEAKIAELENDLSRSNEQLATSDKKSLQKVEALQDENTQLKDLIETLKTQLLSVQKWFSSDDGSSPESSEDRSGPPAMATSDESGTKHNENKVLFTI